MRCLPVNPRISQVSDEVGKNAFTGGMQIHARTHCNHGFR